MKHSKQMKKPSERTIKIIFCAAMYAFLALFVAGLFIFNANYKKIYDCPEVKNAKADFSGVDISPRDVACNLAGEWEFFYDKWIVTDGYDGEPDGMINLPGLWTYKNFGNGRLPASGYASYRMYAENVEAGLNVYVYRYYCNFAYRVFINGELTFRSGEISKIAGETVVTGDIAERLTYLTDGSPLEIVIEISATGTGGFNAAPWLAASATGVAYGSSLRSFNYIALGIATAAVAVSILTYAFFRYRRDITLPAFMLALYAHFLSSKDMLYVFSFQITATMLIGLFSAVAAFVLLMLHFRRCGARLNKAFVAVTASAGAVFTALTVAFYGTPLATAFGFALFFIGCCYIAPVVFNPKFAAIQRAAYGVLFMFLMSVFCFELCDGLGLLVFGTEFIFTFELVLIIACFAALWLWKLAKTARTAIRVSELECELSSVKNQALKAQIKPHFVYNSLTAIQARYRDGLAEGDRAIAQFAKHLRLITDSDGEDMIAFDDEVRNVMNYFELENLRAGGKLNLLLDLNFTDFSVPVLSLQPIVENSIRHGGLRERQDGYIQLSSRKDDNFIVVEVADNGRGFDVNAVHEGVGIENTRKRFALMNAAMRIESDSGGTRTIIQIPLRSSE